MSIYAVRLHLDPKMSRTIPAKKWSGYLNSRGYYRHDRFEFYLLFFSNQMFTKNLCYRIVGKKKPNWWKKKKKMEFGKKEKTVDNFVDESWYRKRFGEKKGKFVKVYLLYIYLKSVKEEDMWSRGRSEPPPRKLG